MTLACIHVLEDGACNGRFDGSYTALKHQCPLHMSMHGKSLRSGGLRSFMTQQDCRIGAA